jgi:lipoate-protein ligase A
VSDKQRLQIVTTQKTRAQENMDVDTALISTHRSGILLRHYRWETAGITIPEKRAIPAELRHYDVGIRPTGGGILFHAPGDFLFSLIAPNHDPRFPKPLSQKMKWLSMAMKSALTQIGLETLPDEDTGVGVERQYCHTYPNPFELRYAGDKVCAFALRRFRHFFIIQGLLHLRSNTHAFPNLGAEYHPYFSEGLQVSPEKETGLIVHFVSECTHIFETTHAHDS